MAETPDDILRALADPEGLAIAGALARADATAAALATAIGLPVSRIRKHLNRLTSTGVVRLSEDRTTYRLDPETLRWARRAGGPIHATPASRSAPRTRTRRPCSARSSATAG
ncbi:MAG: winged helix-turn-helix transcriptional regulator [Actinomycetota bacterium]